MHCLNVGKTGERRNENTCLPKKTHINVQVCNRATLLKQGSTTSFGETNRSEKFPVISWLIETRGWSSSFINQHKALFPHKPHTLSHPYTMQKSPPTTRMHINAHNLTEQQILVWQLLSTIHLSYFMGCTFYCSSHMYDFFGYSCEVW